jgi:hypothetical protein
MAGGEALQDRFRELGGRMRPRRAGLGLLLQLALLLCVQVPPTRQEITPSNQQVVETSWREVKDR